MTTPWRKGIILAGGSGTRLGYLTVATSKQLLPIYDRPMIMYPMHTLVTSGIHDLLVIGTPKSTAEFEMLLGDGSQWGTRIDYATQTHPLGVAHALIVAEEWLGDHPCALILGDNLLHGSALENTLRGSRYMSGATVFSIRTPHPERYGVVRSRNGHPVSFIEKPDPVEDTDKAVPGLYFYPPGVCEVAKMLKPSSRGELEICDIHTHYLKRDELRVVDLPDDSIWLDCGTYDSLLAASNYVAIMDKYYGIRVGGALPPLGSR